MRSEHKIQVPCAVAGDHALRLVIEDLQLLHLSTTCPASLAADASVRLGAPFCADWVRIVRELLRGVEGITMPDAWRPILSDMLPLALDALIAQRLRVAAARQGKVYVQDQRSVRVRLWQRHAERCNAVIRWEVQSVDRVLYLFMHRGGVPTHVVACKPYGGLWAPVRQQDLPLAVDHVIHYLNSLPGARDLPLLVSVGGDAPVPPTYWLRP